MPGLNLQRCPSCGRAADPSTFAYSNAAGDFVKAVALADGVMMGKFFASGSFEDEVLDREGGKLKGLEDAERQLIGSSRDGSRGCGAAQRS